VWTVLISLRRGIHEAFAKNKLAAWFVQHFGQLYVVEKKLRKKTAGPKLKATMRVWQSRPVLTRLRRAMELDRRGTLPQGLLGQAIDYALKRWGASNRFVDEGILEIDTNHIENFGPVLSENAIFCSLGVLRRVMAVR
jgi:transposase